MSPSTPCGLTGCSQTSGPGLPLCSDHWAHVSGEKKRVFSRTLGRARNAPSDPVAVATHAAAIRNAISEAAYRTEAQAS